MRYRFSSLLWPQSYLFPMLKGAAPLSLDSTLYALSIGDQGQLACPNNAKVEELGHSAREATVSLENLGQEHSSRPRLVPVTGSLQHMAATYCINLLTSHPYCFQWLHDHQTRTPQGRCWHTVRLPSRLPTARRRASYASWSFKDS